MRLLNSLLFYGMLTISCAAHPLSMSAVEFDYAKTGAVVRISILVEDLVLLQNLIADGEARYGADDLQAAARSHLAFVRRHFDVHSGTGQKLMSEYGIVDASSIPDKGLFEQELMRHEVQYILVYRFPSNPPEHITIRQWFGGAEKVLPAVMDLVLLQDGALIDKPLRLEAGKPYSWRVDWSRKSDVPLDLQALRAYREEERQRTLGIASYAGVYSYLYKTEQGLRHEILVPALTFEEWTTIDRKDPDILTVKEQDRLRDRALNFFAVSNAVMINGERVIPQLVSFDVIGLEVVDLANIGAPYPVRMDQARFAVMLSYGHSDLRPNSISYTWGTFSRSVSSLRSRVFVDGHPVREHTFTRTSPEWQWSGSPGRKGPSLTRKEIPLPKFQAQRLSALLLVFGSVILVSGLLIALKYERRKLSAGFGLLVVVLWLLGRSHVEGRAVIMDQHFDKQVVPALLNNLYAAMGVGDRAAIYDALEDTVSARALSGVFDELDQVQLVQEQSAMRIQVHALEVEKVEPSRKQWRAWWRMEFGGHITWTVSGSVEHWGHVHTRKNRYAASMEFQIIDGHWKIVEYLPQESALIEKRTRIRE